MTFETIGLQMQMRSNCKAAAVSRGHNEVSSVVIACIFYFIHFTFCKKFTFVYIDHIYDGFSILLQFICCYGVRP